MRHEEGPRGKGANSKSAAWQRQGEDTSPLAPNAGTPPPLLEELDALETGRRRRDDGLRTAELNTWHPWKVKALDELRRWSRERLERTTDDLVDVVGEPPLSSTGSVGALVQGAARRGWIVNTGRYVPSRRASANARRIAVWRGTGGGL